MYPFPLSPRTAEEAYSYVPQTATDCYLRASTSCARSRIPFARHALLELRSCATGKRRKLTTGHIIIPLCSPTNDQAMLDANIAVGAQIAQQVNDWIAFDWAKENGCVSAVIAKDFPRTSINGEWGIEVEQWLEEFCASMYIRMYDRIGFRAEEYEFHFRMRWAGRM